MTSDDSSTWFPIRSFRSNKYVYPAGIVESKKTDVLVLTVTDSGAGISKVRINSFSIFIPFQYFRRRTKRSYSWESSSSTRVNFRLDRALDWVYLVSPHLIHSLSVYWTTCSQQEHHRLARRRHLRWIRRRRTGKHFHGDATPHSGGLLRHRRRVYVALSRPRHGFLQPTHRGSVPAIIVVT